jgi:hypothetical protein
MVQGWTTEEFIEFVIDYMDLQAIGKPISRHKGRLSGKGTRGHTTFNVDYVTYTKHISQFYNNPFQWLSMSECMFKCYDSVIRRSPKTELQGNTETILVVGYIIKLWIRMQVLNWLTQTLMT